MIARLKVLCAPACALTLCFITFTLLHFKVASGECDHKRSRAQEWLKGNREVRHCGYDKRQAMWQNCRAAQEKGKPKTA